MKGRDDQYQFSSFCFLFWNKLKNQSKQSIQLIKYNHKEKIKTHLQSINGHLNRICNK